MYTHLNTLPIPAYQNQTTSLSPHQLVQLTLKQLESQRTPSTFRSSRINSTCTTNTEVVRRQEAVLPIERELPQNLYAQAQLSSHLARENTNSRMALSKPQEELSSQEQLSQLQEKINDLRMKITNINVQLAADKELRLSLNHAPGKLAAEPIQLELLSDPVKGKLALEAIEFTQQLQKLLQQASQIEDMMNDDIVILDPNEKEDEGNKWRVRDEQISNPQVPMEKERTEEEWGYLLNEIGSKITKNQLPKELLLTLLNMRNRLAYMLNSNAPQAELNNFFIQINELLNKAKIPLTDLN